MISNSEGNCRSQNRALVYRSRLPPPPLQSGTPANRARFVGRSRCLRPAKMCSSFRSGSDRHNRYTFSAARRSPPAILESSWQRAIWKKRINRNEMDARELASLLAMTASCSQTRRRTERNSGNSVYDVRLAMVWAYTVPVIGHSP